MTYKDLVKLHNKNSPSRVEVRLVEDDDVPQGECYVQGWFNHLWQECAENTPAVAEVAVNVNADIPEEEVEALVNEIVVAINHELVHDEQHREGRYIEVWEGEYVDNPNEIEAYAREGKSEYYK